jgi:hypothetical protein
MTMLPRHFPRFLFAFAVLALAFWAALPALAHTRTEIGPYVVIVGWVDEPPVVGQRNALYFEISRDGEPVTGVESSLDVEIGYGGRTMRANLSPADTPGTYTATFVPTVRGQYDVRLFGAIEDTAVDQVVQPEEVGDGAMLFFPEMPPDTRAMQEQIAQLESDLSTARMLSLVALAAAAAGIALAALALARRGGR